MNRLFGLDYLRGIASLSVMIYHYSTYSFGSTDASTFLCRTGTYAVGIFYILSGITLYKVYYHKMENVRTDVYDFFKKRCFRILPLLWLATILTLIIKGIKPDLYMLFLNLTGLFGFIKWDAYWAAGAWSIGNEMVFYALFPFFIFFTKYQKKLMVLLSLTILAIYLYFAFYKIALDPAGYFINYINPLNNAFLFLGGYLIGLLFDRIHIKLYWIIPLLLAAFGLFIFYPASGDRVSLLIGPTRLLFTLICFVMCFSFYKLTQDLPKLIHKPLTLLGEASYSVYLLHPIIYLLVGIFRDHSIYFNEYVRVTISIILTLIISHFTYNYFEKYFMKFGQSRNTNPV